MSIITLPDGTQHNITKDNSDALAQEALRQYDAKGINVDQAATYQAFLEAAGRDTAFQGALEGPGSTAVNFDALGANQAAAQLPWLANASYSVTTSVDKTLASLKAALPFGGIDPGSAGTVVLAAAAVATIGVAAFLLWRLSR